MRNVRKFGVMVVAAISTLAAWGCSSPPKFPARDVEVFLGQSLTAGSTPSVEVDIVGVQKIPAEKSVDLEQIALDKYFAPGNPIRQNQNKYTMYFGPNDTAAEKLEKTNRDVWGKWDEPTHLIVLASLQGDFGSGGISDQRRIVIPLQKEHYGSKDVIRIELQNTGLALRTSLKPIKE